MTALPDLPQRPGRLHEVPPGRELDLAFREGERFPVELLELGLVVEEIDVGGPAVHEEKDDPSGAGRERGGPGAGRPGPPGEEGIEGEPTEAEPDAIQGRAPGEDRGAWRCGTHRT